MNARRLYQSRSTRKVVETLPSDAQLDGPSVTLSAFVRPCLTPKLAVVLAGDVWSAALPGDVARAVTGVFLAVDIVDPMMPDPENLSGRGGFLLGEHLLPLEARGGLRLRLAGALCATEDVADFGDPIDQISSLASQLNGLHAGDTVILTSGAAPVPARAGTLLLEGPGDSMLIADLRAAE